jgi:hypothetical protein
LQRRLQLMRLICYSYTIPLVVVASAALALVRLSSGCRCCSSLTTIKNSSMSDGLFHGVCNLRYVSAPISSLIQYSLCFIENGTPYGTYTRYSTVTGLCDIHSPMRYQNYRGFHGRSNSRDLHHVKARIRGLHY